MRRYNSTAGAAAAVGCCGASEIKRGCWLLRADIYNIPARGGSKAATATTHDESSYSLPEQEHIVSSVENDAPEQHSSRESSAACGGCGVGGEFGRESREIYIGGIYNREAECRPILIVVKCNQS